jgi:hypothetical protein
VSSIITFFAAPIHGAAAAVLAAGPDGVFDALPYGNFDAEEALTVTATACTGSHT